MGTTSSCCSCTTQADKLSEIAAPGLQAVVKYKALYQANQVNAWQNWLKSTTYHILIGKSAKPEVIEISHMQNWEITKVTLNNQEIMNVNDKQLTDPTLFPLKFSTSTSLQCTVTVDHVQQCFLLEINGKSFDQLPKQLTGSIVLNGTSILDGRLAWDQSEFRQLISEKLGPVPINSCSLSDISCTDSSVLKAMVRVIVDATSSKGWKDLALNGFQKDRMHLGEVLMDGITEKCANLEKLCIGSMHQVTDEFRQELIRLTCKIAQVATELKSISLEKFGNSSEEGCHILQGILVSSIEHLTHLKLGSNAAWWLVDGNFGANEIATEKLEQILRRQYRLIQLSLAGNRISGDSPEKILSALSGSGALTHLKEISLTSCQFNTQTAAEWLAKVIAGALQLQRCEIGDQKKHQSNMPTHARIRGSLPKGSLKFENRRVKVNVAAAQIQGNLDRLQGHVMIYDPDTQETIFEVNTMRVKQITIVQD